MLRRHLLLRYLRRRPRLERHPLVLAEQPKLGEHLGGGGVQEVLRRVTEVVRVAQKGGEANVATQRKLQVAGDDSLLLRS